jgi:pyruvate dehydrogenase E2 component (dihydrolipoamide acetyltransferase)
MNGQQSVPHSRLRRTIARRLTESKATVPHFYLSGDVQVDRLLAVRSEANEGRTQKISVNDFLVRIVGVALTRVPAANVSWTEDAMVRHASADVAVAVATDDGLLTPIVRAAEAKSLGELSDEITDLVTRARSGRLHPSEFEGGSFTISNLGMYGIEEFSAIINPPQSAILAVGAARKAAIVRDDQLVIGTVMRCTLSVDHRAIDGALAAEWFAEFVRLVESPAAALV